MPEAPTPDNNIYIIKMNGEREPFEERKLRRSLEKAGADEEAIQEIVEEIENVLEDGMTTHEIYKRAYNKLERIERTAAARYSLRKALLGFGPSGFPFEFFIGEIFRARGYTVETGVDIKGACVSHEVDMIASKPDEYIAMEVKFHNSQRIKSDLKVALYVKARFDDILKAEHNKEQFADRETSGWLLTNTKFTANALRYADCSGLTIISWNYPEEGNLQDLVEEAGLHPITCLTSLPEREKALLLNEGNVLCRDIKKDPDILKKAGIEGEKRDEIVEEAARVCTPRPDKQTRIAQDN